MNAKEFLIQQLDNEYQSIKLPIQYVESLLDQYYEIKLKEIVDSKHGDDKEMCEECNGAGFVYVEDLKNR